MHYSNRSRARRLRPSREIARPALHDLPSRQAIPCLQGRVQAPAISTRVTKVVTACSSLAFEAVPNLLCAVLSWIMAEAWAGCAAYGEAMYPAPAAIERAEQVPATRPGLSLISTQVKSGSAGGNPMAQTGAIVRTVATSAESDSTMPQSDPDWRVRLGLVIAACWSRLWRAHQRRRAIAELKGLDEHSLRDIGLARCEIETILRHGARRE